MSRISVALYRNRPYPYSYSLLVLIGRASTRGGLGVWGLSQCMLGYTPRVWAWRPPRCGPGETLPLVWAWRPPWPDPSTSTPWVWAWKPHPLLQGMLGYHLQCILGYHLPPTHGQTDTCKNINININFVCGRYSMCAHTGAPKWFFVIFAKHTIQILIYVDVITFQINLLYFVI